MRRHALALLLLGVLVIAAAGCGEPSAVAMHDRTIRIVETEYRLTPQNVTVRAGRLTLIAVNRGRLIHNLAVERITDDPDVTPEPLGKSDTLHPGETSRPLRITLGPGRYRLVCTIANHDDLGQYGTLHVTR